MQNSKFKIEHSGLSPNPWLVMALVSIPVFIGALDMTIISAILPKVIIELQIPLESGLDDAAWAVSGYLLAYTISITFMGRVSDLFGRRRAYLICLLIFIFGSVWVAVADGFVADLFYGAARRLGMRPDPAEVALLSLIIGRVIQAFGGGSLVPISMALVGDLFPPQRRAQPLGLIGAVNMGGWVVGALYGGVMVQALNWRALFWLNVPLGLLALAATWWVLRGVQQTRAQGRFDFLGAALLAFTLAAITLGLGANTEVTTDVTSFEQMSTFPPYAGPLLLAAALTFALFLLLESRLRSPLVSLRLFRQRNFAAGNVVSLIIGYVLMVGLVSVPILINLRAQDAYHLEEAALRSGLVMSALTIPIALAAIPGGWLSDRYGHRLPVISGLALAIGGFILAGLTWTEEVSYVVMALEMVPVGIGLGLTMSPTSAAVLNAAPDDQRGVAAAIDDMLRMLGMTVATASLTTIALRRISALAVTQIGSVVAMTQEAVDVYVVLVAQVIREMALFGALLCLLALIPAWFLRGGRAADFEAEYGHLHSESPGAEQPKRAAGESHRPVTGN